MNLEDCFEQGLLKRVRKDQEAAKMELEKAKDYLKKAKMNFDMKIHDLTVVAAYTSMFHAARSLLFKDGIKERSHVCVVIYLQSKYPELGGQAKILDSYRRFRHIALYAVNVAIDDKDAQESLRLAELFRREIAKII